MTKLKRYVPLLALTILLNARSSLSLPLEEQKDDHTKLVGSSIVASVSVVTQEKNGSSSPGSRKVVPVYEPLASPADLLRPDRFQFYTFNNNGEVVTKQMTEKEIQSLIAAGGGHYPMEIHEPVKTENMLAGDTKVADVVQNVQNVLKGELSKPTTMMVPVPTVPGHATDEWSNILPSILSGDSESSHPANGISQFDDDKGAMSKPTAHQPANAYDMYKPQPAIIVEMEPHVHESPSQILAGSDFLDHHVRPLDLKPHLVKPDTDKDDSLDEVPLKTWNTPSKGPDFHFITTEIVPLRNGSDVRPKPPMDVDHRNKNATAEQTLSMYSEIPMIPVSVITADQILTSTQKNKVNERPIFQMLSTISPSAVASTPKPDDMFDQKSDDVSIVSETHTTSVKYPGRPEMKVPGEGITMPVKMRPTMEETKTTSRLTAAPTTDSTTESIWLTTFSILSEKQPAKLTEETSSPKIQVTTVPSTESLARTTTEMTPEMIETTIMNEVTTTKDFNKQDMNEMKTESTTEKMTMTTVTERISERTTMPTTMKEETTIYEQMTTMAPPVNDMMDSSEVLTSDLANSLSSVISQVAETIPSILADTQNFPMSELKNKNISMSNEMFDSTTTRDMDEEFSTITEDLTIRTTMAPSSEQSTVQESTIIPVTDRSDITMTPTERSDVTFEKILDTTTQLDATTMSVTEEKLPTTTMSSAAPTTSTTPSIPSEAPMMTKVTEKDPEAAIIHLDVTQAPAIPQFTTEDGNNTSESPLIRIQLADIVSAVNHMVENASVKPEPPSTLPDMTLPPNPYTASPNIASGLIAGFPSSTTQQDVEAVQTSTTVADEVTTMMFTDKETETNKITEPMVELKTEATVLMTDISSAESQTQPIIVQNTTPMENAVTEIVTSEDKVETTTTFVSTEISEMTTAELAQETMIELMTTTEPSTTSSVPDKTKKPESEPIVRIDVSPENTSSQLPPRIQLTDLPIVQESTTPNSVASMEKENSTMSDSNDIDKPSLYIANTNDSTINVNTEMLTTVPLSQNSNIESATTQVPCTSDISNLSRCQNYTEATKIGDAQMERNDTVIVSDIDLNKTTTEASENITQSETVIYNKTELPSDIVKIKEPLHLGELIPEKPINYVQMPLKNESKTSYEELLKPIEYKNASVPEFGIKTNTSSIKNVSSTTTTIKNLIKEEIKITTETPIKPTPSKQDSYIKLGEQLTKEPVNKTSLSSRPPKPSKRPTTSVKPSTTTKPSTHKVQYTPPTHKFSPKPTKAPSTTNHPPAPVSEKKPEPVTEINKTNEDQKWTLIPQQSSSVYSNKVKPEASESPVSSSTMFPSGDLSEYSQRTGSKPVNLEVVKNSAGLDDSVRNLDQDIQFFANLCNELAFSFWTSANKGLSNSRSLALSPFGMTSMLAMIFLGARGPTSAQMNDILKLDDVATFNPHLVFQNITDTVSLARNQGIANAAFVRLLFADRIKVGKLMAFYKEQAQKFYEGFVAEVNFSTISDQVKRRTNLLIRKQTGGRIKDFMKTNSVPLRSPLAALSANVFQTNCNISGASSEGRDGEMFFAVSPAVRQRRLVPVPATVWRSGVLAGYEPGLDATAIALGGSEKLVSTIFVIPGQQGFTAPGDTLDRLEQRLMRSAYRDKAWDKLLKVIVPRPALELQVPKFSHRSVVNATAALKRMGLEELFTRHANLKGINGFGHDIHLADVLQMNLFSTCGDENISSGRHHVEIYPGSPMRNNRKIDFTKEVDSFESTKTSSTADPSSSERFTEDQKNPRFLKNWSREAEVGEKPRLRLDRPFLYFVRHNPTGLILHMGRFNPRLLQ